MPNTTNNNLTNNSSTPDSTENDINLEKKFISKLTAFPISSSTIGLTWLINDPHINNYYNICYTADDNVDSCQENGTYLQTTFNSVKINDLRAYTFYKFQVKVNDGPFSNIVECRTSEGQASEVRFLNAKIVTSKIRVIEWEPPLYHNGDLHNFVVFYIVADEAYLPINKWESVAVPVNTLNVQVIKQNYL